jgi:transposase-like protein
MVSDSSMRTGRRRRLSPSEKWEVFTVVLSGQATQREAADRFGVDRSTVVTICRTAKRAALEAFAAAVAGRLGVSPEQAQLERLSAEIERLRATVTEQALSLPLHAGKARWDSSAGPVPPRVGEHIKAGLLDLIDHAVERGGWSLRRAAGVLGLDEVRAARWDDRRAAGTLADTPSGGVPLHALLETDKAAILELFEAGATSTAATASWPTAAHAWGWCTSASRRCCGCWPLKALFCQESRVATRSPASRGQSGFQWKPNRIWVWDFPHFTRAKRAAVAVLDVVSRKWITTLVSAEETSTQLETVFTAALESEGLLDRADALATDALRAALASDDPDPLAGLTAAGQVPLLLAISDNAPADALLLHPRIPRRRRNHPAVRPTPHPTRPSLDRNPVRARQRRMATPGADPRPRRAGSRAGPHPGPIQQGQVAHRHRLRHPRR